jgi:hypothetical protein
MLIAPKSIGIAMRSRLTVYCNNSCLLVPGYALFPILPLAGKEEGGEIGF